MYAIQITARPFLHEASLIYAVRLVDGVYTGLGSASTVCLGSTLIHDETSLKVMGLCGGILEEISDEEATNFNRSTILWP